MKISCAGSVGLKHEPFVPRLARVCMFSALFWGEKMGIGICFSVIA